MEHRRIYNSRAEPTQFSVVRSHGPEPELQRLAQWNRLVPPSTKSSQKSFGGATHQAGGIIPDRRLSSSHKKPRLGRVLSSVGTGPVRRLTLRYLAPTRAREVTLSRARAAREASRQLT